MGLNESKELYMTRDHIWKTWCDKTSDDTKFSLCSEDQQRETAKVTNLKPVSDCPK